MSEAIIKARECAEWCDAYVKPLIASLAGQGHIDPAKALRLMEGMEVMLQTMQTTERHVDVIREAVQAAINRRQP